MAVTAEPIYMDFNATTPVAPEVLEAMMPFLTTAFGNPSSDHTLGRQARSALGDAREQVASLVGAQADEILFTSGGTESNNLAIRGSALPMPASRYTVIATVLEHPSVLEPCAALEREGWTVEKITATSSGSLDFDDMTSRMRSGVGIVTAMLAQNETGAMLPIAEVATAGHDVGAIVHTDAAQAVGKVPVNVDLLGVDLLSIAGHKMYAPKGIGALYVRRGTRLDPFARGAGQEFGMRPGTENVAFAVGLGAAASLAATLLAQESARMRELRELLWNLLHSSIPGTRRLTPDESLPNTLLLSFPGLVGAELLAQAPGIAASTGSACHAGTHTPSAVLAAMQVAPEVALGAVRFSLGRTTTETDVATAVAILVEAHGSLLGE